MKIFLLTLFLVPWLCRAEPDPVAAIVNHYQVEEARLAKVSAGLMEQNLKELERKKIEKAIDETSKKLRQEALSKLAKLGETRIAESMKEQVAKQILLLAEPEDGIDLERDLKKISNGDLSIFSSEEISVLIDKFYATPFKAVEPLLTKVIEQHQIPDVKAQAMFRMALRFKSEAEDALRQDSMSRDVSYQKATALFERLKREHPERKLYFTKTLGEISSRLVEDMKEHRIGSHGQELKAIDTSGKLIKLSDHLGGPVILFFYGDWCPHSRELYVRLKDLLKKYPQLTIIGISNDSEKEIVQSVQKNSLPWSIIGDGNEGPIQSAWAIRSWPTLHVLDRKGTLRFKGVQSQDLNQLMDLLAREESQTEGRGSHYSSGGRKAIHSSAPSRD